MKIEKSMKAKSVWFVMTDDDGFDVLVPLRKIDAEKEVEIIEWIEARHDT